MMKYDNRLPNEHKFALFFAVVSILTTVVLMGSGWISYSYYVDSQLAAKQQLRAKQLGGSILYLDEVLTMSARMAVTTNDPRWELRYRQFEPLLESAIEEAIELAPDSYGGVVETKREIANKALVGMESRAFELLRAGRADDARAILFSSDFETQKQIYDQGMQEFSTTIAASVNDKWQSGRRTMLRYALPVLLLIPVLLVAWTVIFRAMRRWRRILVELNRSLNTRIVERTAKLSTATKVLKTEIAERQRAKAALLESEVKYRTLVELSPCCIYHINTEGLFLSMNRAGLDMIEVTAEQDIIGAPCLSTVCDEDQDRISTMMQAAYAGEIREFEFQGAGGHDFRSTLVPIYDVDGKIDRLLGITQDITEHKRTEHPLLYQASDNALTTLVNCREFENRVENVLATVKQTKTEHVLCLLNLDQFKIVNDSCGYVAGDELLRQLSVLLQKTVRDRDTLAHLGGDEFGVLMEYCSLESALWVAKLLKKAIQEHQFVWQGLSFRVGVSIGLVAITSSSENLPKLLSNADIACYMAKEKGRGCIQIYHPEDVYQNKRVCEIERLVQINHALEEDRLCLYAQSIVSLNGGSGKHYELLLRILDEVGNTIAPGAFLPTAERYDVISEIDLWVIENAFSLMAECPEFIKQIDYCSINLSGQSLTSPEVLDFIVSKLRNSGIQGEKICFEITETAAVSNLRTAEQFMSTIKAFGCHFTLNDFGSGLTSFGYLKQLPVDYLKIDGMFVKNMVNDPIDHEMVKSINEIGQVMGMQTIATFVENYEIKNALTMLGVNYAQGYGIGKPEPFNEVLKNC